jgi:hypothetical protein
MKMKISVGESVIADREPVHDVFGNMVEKNQPQREAAKQVEAQIAARRDRRQRLRHGERLDQHRLGKERLHNRLRPPQHGGMGQSTKHGRHFRNLIRPV